jgi:cytochrome c553
MPKQRLGATVCRRVPVVARCGVQALVAMAALVSVAAAQSTSGVLTPAAQARLPVCQACHGANGVSERPGAPSLAAQPALFLENRLVMLREGLSDAPEMKGLLDGLSDPDLIALSRHYAAMAPPSPARAEPARAARGAVVAQRAGCGSCHLPDQRGREQIPRLAGQREDYLLASMRAFASGKTSGRDTQMTNALLGLSDGDLQDLAHHLASLRAP